MNSGNTFKQLSLREIIAQQTKTNDEVKQRLDTNESSLKDIHNKMDFLLTALDEQYTLNKRVELKLAKLAAALPVATNIEQVKNITTRGGKVSVFSPPGVTPTSEFVCVLPFPDGDARRHKDFILVRAREGPTSSGGGMFVLSCT
jgi:soluble cytochrome b562